MEKQQLTYLVLSMLLLSSSALGVSCGGLTCTLNVTLTVGDTAPPSVTINEPIATAYNSTNITLNTTISDVTSSVDSCWYSLDNWATNTSYDCNYTTFIASEGSNTVRVAANDTIGNLNDTESVTFTVDLTPPSVTLNEPIATAYASTNITLNTTITDSYLDSCWYSIDNWVTNTSYDCNLTTFIASEGSNTVRVAANDTANNLNDTESVTFTVDISAPSVIITSPIAKTYSTKTINLITTITDPLLDSCWYSIDNWVTNTSYDCSYTTFTVAEGNNTVRVAANDTLGNLNDTESVTFTVTVTAPTPPSGGSTYFHSKTLSSIKLGVFPEAIRVNRSTETKITLVWEGEPAICALDISPELEPYILFPKDLFDGYVTELPELLLSTGENEIPIRIKATEPVQGTITFLLETTTEKTSMKLPIIIEPAMNLTAGPTCGDHICCCGEDFINCNTDCPVPQKTIIFLLIAGGLVLYLIWPDEGE